LAACADDPLPVSHPLPKDSFLSFARRTTPPPEIPKPPAAAKPMAIDENFPRLFAATRGFKLGTPRDMHPTEDGKIVFFLRAKKEDARQSLWELDVAANQEREILSPDALDKGAAETLSHEERARRERLRINTSGFTAYEATKDGAHVVVTLSGRLFVWTRGKEGAVELKTGPGAVIDPHLSPDGSRVAYVRDADIYGISVNGGREEKITTGGTEKKTRGLAEFIAQEELDRSRGFWWSPDGKNILYEESDTSKVETLFVLDPAHPERAPDANPYPRAGTTNATLRFGFVGSHGGATKWVALDNEKFPYVATVTWTKNAPPTFYVLDRAQRNSLLLTADPRSGKTSELLHEHDDAWINVDSSVPKWLDDGSAFLWSSDRSGSNVLELHDKSGALTNNFALNVRGYRKLLAVDSKARIAYVESGEDAADQAITPILFGGQEGLSISFKGRFASGNFGDSLHVVARRDASVDHLPVFSAQDLSTVNGRVPIQSLNAAPPFTANVQYVQVGADHYRVAVVRPRNYVAGSRIPLIDAAYGGPGYNVVIDDMSAYLRAQWISDVTGAMVVSIDAKGTPGRGRDWERALVNKMGDVPLEGHVAAIEALEKQFPEIDPLRVGIYGWSFGGYLSAYAALKRPDIYRVAVIGAPPADWRDYDTCYTERYLGTPQQNKDAYDQASLLTLAASPPQSMTGVAPAAMLVVQGTADDNVYFLNSLKLTSALATGNRPYSFVPIPGVTHQLFTPETSGPIWVQIASFLRDHLLADR
jgi:dipeptidyl-peptidase-4